MSEFRLHYSGRDADVRVSVPVFRDADVRV